MQNERLQFSDRASVGGGTRQEASEYSYVTSTSALLRGLGNDFANGLRYENIFSLLYRVQQAEATELEFLNEDQDAQLAKDGSNKDLNGNPKRSLVAIVKVIFYHFIYYYELFQFVTLSMSSLYWANPNAPGIPAVVPRILVYLSDLSRNPFLIVGAHHEVMPLLSMIWFYFSLVSPLLVLLIAFVLLYFHNNNANVKLEAFRVWAWMYHVACGPALMPFLFASFSSINCTHQPFAVKFDGADAFSCALNSKDINIFIALCQILVLAFFCILRICLPYRITSHRSYFSSPNGHFHFYFNVVQFIQVGLLSTTGTRWPLASAISGLILNAALFYRMLYKLPFYEPFENLIFAMIFSVSIGGFGAAIAAIRMKSLYAWFFLLLMVPLTIGSWAIISFQYYKMKKLLLRFQAIRGVESEIELAEEGVLSIQNTPTSAEASSMPFTKKHRFVVPVSPGGDAFLRVGSGSGASTSTSGSTTNNGSGNGNRSRRSMEDCNEHSNGPTSLTNLDAVNPHQLELAVRLFSSTSRLNRFLFNRNDEINPSKLYTVYQEMFERASISGNRTYFYINASLFLVEHPFMLGYISKVMAEALMSGPWIDSMYLLYCVEQRRLELESGRVHNSALRDLRAATKHIKGIKSNMKALWQKLLSDNPDTSKFPSIITAIENHESQCDLIFTQLFNNNPNPGSKVLRVFGKYVLEVKKDFEVADQIFAQADAAEEAESQAATMRRLQNSSSSSSSSSMPQSGRSANRRGSQPNNLVTATNTTSSSSSNGPNSNSNSNVHNSNKEARRGSSYNNNNNSSSTVVAAQGAPTEARTVPFSMKSLAGANNDPTSLTLESMSPVKAIRPNAAGGEAHADLDIQQLEDDAPFKAFDNGSSIGTTDPEEHNRLRYRRMRHNLQNATNSAVSQMMISVIVSLVVLFVLLLSSFAVTIYLIDEFTVKNSIVVAAAQNQMYVQSLSRNLRLYEVSLAGVFPASEIPAIQRKATTAATGLLSLTRQLYHNSTVINNSFYLPQWSQNTVALKYYFAAPENNGTQSVTRYTNLYDSSSMMVNKAVDVMNMCNSTQCIYNSTDYKFVVQNGATSIAFGWHDLANAYLDKFSKETNYIIGIITGQLLGSLVVIGSIMLVIFVPAYVRIRNEWKTTMQLFHLIPKSAVKSILDTLNDDSGGAGAPTGGGNHGGTSAPSSASDPHDLSFRKKEKSVFPTFTILLLRYVAALVLFTLIIIAFSSVAFINIIWFRQNSHELFQSVRRRYFSYRMDFLCGEYMYNGSVPLDPDSFDSSLRYLSNFASLNEIHQALRFGDKTLGVVGSNNRIPALDHLNYDMKCQDQQSLSCLSLDTLFRLFVDAIENFFSSTPQRSNQYADNVYYRQAQEILTILDEDYVKAVDIYSSLYHDSLQYCRVFLIVVFTISCALFIVYYMVLFHTAFRQMRGDSIQIKKIIMLLPLEVLDTIPALGAFLMSNGSDTRKNTTAAFHEMTQRSQAILQASVDAVVQFDEKYSINSFNKAAESMMLYRSSEIIGKRIHTLFEENDAQTFITLLNEHKAKHVSGNFSFMREFSARRKDGTTFPIRASVACAASSIVANNLYVLFIRDITSERRQHELLKIEKKRSEDLLLNVLPKSIALRLQNEQLIADYHEEITVLFADMVSFTRMSSTLSPTELVRLLNDLFVALDHNCERFGIEKIKTIGDCYLCASGVPIARHDHAEAMMEFAIAMLEFIEQYNAKNGTQLQFRIGINTGPAVAGVIGAKKYCYDLWGDSINVASRMESTGVANRIQVSRSTYALVHDKYIFEDRGEIEIKGKGLMNGYLYAGRRNGNNNINNKNTSSTTSLLGTHDKSAPSNSSSQASITWASSSATGGL